jgi:hypothetical protein
VTSHAHEIELFYLPAYAPDHNPTEYLNNDLIPAHGRSDLDRRDRAGA